MTAVQRLADLAGLVVTGSPQHRRTLARYGEVAVSPLSVGRRVAVLGAVPAAGVTTVVARTTAILAARRPRPVLAVDAAAGQRPLAQLLGVLNPMSMVRAAHEFAGPLESSLDVVRAVPLSPIGGHLLGAGTPGGDPAINRVGSLWQQVVPSVSRFFDLTITDAGSRSELVFDLLHQLHGVAVVCGGHRAAIARAGSLLGELSARRGCPPLLLIAVDTSHEMGDGRAVWPINHRLAGVVTIPHDAALRGGGSRGRLGHLTGGAFRHAAAALVRVVGPEVGP